jgi:hypothetical protein
MQGEIIRLLNLLDADFDRATLSHDEAIAIWKENFSGIRFWQVSGLLSCPSSLLIDFSSARILASSLVQN